MVYLLTALLLARPLAAHAQTSAATTPASDVILEIRSYNLKRGERERFHDLFVRESLPLLVRAKVDVVGYGPSLHDSDSYVLMRAFSSLSARDREEESFYSSPEWRNGPRAAVLAAIESYTTILMRVDRTTLEGLRRNMRTGTVIRR